MALWPFLIGGQRPQVVGLGLGRWEITDHLLDGHWVHVGERAWDAHVTADLRSAISIFHPDSVPEWCCSPCPTSTPLYWQPDGLPWSENEPTRVRAYNALGAAGRTRAHPRLKVSVIDLNRMLSPDGVYTASLHGVDVRSTDGIHISPAGDGPAAAPDSACDRVDWHGGGDGSKGSRVTEPGDGGQAPAAEVVVESVSAAMALAPNAVGPNLGAELFRDAAARPGVESMRTGLLQAGPLAVAGVLANGASVVLTVALARLLAPHGYGVLNQLTGLYLILSMPGSAVVVAVVRRVTMWHEDGSGHLVRRWAGRVHRQGTMLVLLWAVIVFVSRHGVAVLLNQQSGIGIAAILTAAAFFVLLSLDRGLLQAHRGYRPLAVNLVVEATVRVAAVLVLVLAGFGPSGAAVGVLLGEVVATAHALRRGACVVRRQEPACARGRGWAAAVRPDPVLAGGASERRTVALDLVVASVSPLHGGGAPERRRARGRTGQPGPQRCVCSGVGDEQGGRLRRHRPGRLPPARSGHPLAPGRPRVGSWPWCSCSLPSSVVLMTVAVVAPKELLDVLFHHDYTSAADALAPLVLAMILLSISVVLTMYLLAVGRRWVAGVLVGGAAVLTAAVRRSTGRRGPPPTSTWPSRPGCWS